ncbi:MAG TPA: acyl-CoA dehydrogenase family protein [Marmoricola sp.]|nr:acyl-CoA dehydrogenase family protein [Marmoricola sp.]
MDFTLDSEQAALRDAVRGLLKGYDAEHRREVVADEPGFDEKMWGRLAEMGALGLPFPEDDGGVGAGPVEVAVVAEEVGRVLAPEPFVESVVLAGGLVAARGSQEQRSELLGAVTAGELVLAFAWSDPTGGEAGVTVDGETLIGVKEPVLNGGRADALVVFAEGQLFLVPAETLGGETVTRTSYRSFDGSHAARIAFDRTPVVPLGDGGDATEATQDVIAAAVVAYCHEALGAMDTALQLTTEYLKTRKQFGVTLNRFQSLTFRAADMYMSLELTRSIVTWATMVLADPDQSPERKREAAARAKLQVSRAGRHVGQEAIQLHGGIGMTAEYAVGHYTARLTAIDHLLGDGRQQVRNLSRRLSEYGVVEPLP